MLTKVAFDQNTENSNINSKYILLLFKNVLLF